MTLKRTKWLLFIVPALTIGTFETIRHTILKNILSMGLGNWTTALIDAIVITLITRTIIHRLHQAEKEIHDQQRLQAISDERNRLANVLHDEIAQSLFYSGVQLHAAKQHTKLYRDSQLEDNLNEVILSLRDIDNNIRQSVFNLKNDPVDNSSLYSRFFHYLQRRLTNTSIEWELNAPEYVPSLSETNHIQIFSILQEAVTNIVRHAEATKLKVSLTTSLDLSSYWTFTIQDNGIGMNEPTMETRNFGLEIMEQRAERLGADFFIESAPTHGTIVRIEHS